ncbi:MAG TPA: hypothetical protein VET90_01290, partial [Candidatus Binatus sp.]|nr:hypothetical protein [Candidatus Binatus sp.]
MILVLQSVELSFDIIEDVVARVRAEGIEYLEEARRDVAPVELAEAVAEAVAENVVDSLAAELDVEAEPTDAPSAPSVGAPDAKEESPGPAGPISRLRRRARPEPPDEVMERQAPRLGRGRIALYSSGDHGGGAAADPVHTYL